MGIKCEDFQGAGGEHWKNGCHKLTPSLSGKPVNLFSWCCCLGIRGGGPNEEESKGGGSNLVLPQGNCSFRFAGLERGLHGGAPMPRQLLITCGLDGGEGGGNGRKPPQRIDYTTFVGSLVISPVLEDMLGGGSNEKKFYYFLSQVSTGGGAPSGAPGDPPGV